MSDDKPASTYADDTVLQIMFEDGSTEKFQILTSVFQGEGQEVIMPYNCIDLSSTFLYRDFGQEDWHARKGGVKFEKVTITIVGAPDASREKKRGPSKGQIRRNTRS